MAKKKKRLDLTDQEIKELAKKGEDVWVVYEHGRYQSCPANIFINSKRQDRIFYANYWLALGESLRRKKLLET